MESFTLDTRSGTRLAAYRWTPGTTPVATLQIAHGMGEHAQRYDAFAEAMNAQGYLVVAADHRGHGATADQDGLGDMGDDGWNRTIADAYDLHEHIVREHPQLPSVLLGHSMGAMLTQQYLYRYGGDLNAVVLSGSPGFGGAFQLWLSHTIARFERWRQGPAGESELLQQMIFGDANKAFDGDQASGFEWLSRDDEQVARYAADTLCGFVLRAGSLANLFAGAREARRRGSLATLPRQVPVYVFSGSDDPVHGDEKGLKRLLRAYERQFDALDYKLYPGGRHEMLNELNRDEVVDDLTRWLTRTLF